jgi:hypothetical protein
MAGRREGGGGGRYGGEVKKKIEYQKVGTKNLRKR